MEKIKVLVETNDLKRKFFQRIVEYNGHKFRYSFTATGDEPCASIGGDWYQALEIMLSDGTFKQIEDIVSVGGPYTHSDMAYAKDIKSVLDMVITDYKYFDDYIKRIY